MRPLAAAGSAPHEETHFWNDRVLIALVASSLALKLVLALLAAGTEPVLDERIYLGLAERVAAGEDWPTNFRPPLYLGFLAGVLSLGGSADTARLLQVLLASFCLLPVYALGRSVGGRRSARAAAALVGFDPVLNGFSHLLWSETLFLALLLPGAALLVADFRAERRAPWLGAGVLLGLASLARPQLLTFAPLLVLWSWWVRGEGRTWLRGAALLALGWSLAVVPWSLRNFQATGAFFLVDTNGPYNFLVGTDPRARFVDKDDAWSVHWATLDGRPYVQVAARDPGLAQRRALALAGARIADDPWGFTRKSLWEATHLFTLDDFLARHLRNGWYGDGAPDWLARGYALVAALFTGGLLLAGGLGLVLQPASPTRRLILLTLLHSVALFGLAYSLSRYAVALRPFLALAAAWLAVHPRPALARLSADRRCQAGALLALVLMLAAWSRDLPLLTDMVSTGGASHGYRALP